MVCLKMNTLRIESGKLKIFLIIKIFSYNKLHTYLCFEYQWRCYSVFSSSCKSPSAEQKLGAKRSERSSDLCSCDSNVVTIILGKTMNWSFAE